MDFATILGERQIDFCLLGNSPSLASSAAHVVKHHRDDPAAMVAAAIRIGAPVRDQPPADLRAI
jgi:hypothetical protein